MIAAVMGRRLAHMAMAGGEQKARASRVGPIVGRLSEIDGLTPIQSITC